MPHHKKTTRAFAAMALFSRLVPHPNNFTAILSASVFNGVNFSRRQALVLTLLGYLLTDCLLAWWQHHPVLGSWSLFSYSGLLMITLLAKKTPTNRPPLTVLCVLGYSFAFWCWTNFGCFLTMPEYALNWHGFVQCYTAALPFLQNQCAADTLSSIVFIYAHQYCLRWQAQMQLS